ncbi:MAG: MMPL family transporter [Verrucomicrobiales bacterium]|nr:MMPL family transporter [Verrucomicrobiales bacterium]
MPRLRHLFFTVALAALTLAYLAWGISRISFEVDVTRLLPPDLPEAKGARAFFRHFLRHDQALILLEAADAETAQQTATTLQQSLHQHPELASRCVIDQPETDPDALAELAAWALLNQPESYLDERRTALSADRLSDTLEAYLNDLADSPFFGQGLAGYDPFGWITPLMDQQQNLGASSEFASADGCFRVIYVDLTENKTDYRDTAAQITALRQIVRTTVEQISPHPQWWITGEPAFYAEISQTMEQDMKRSGITTLLLTTLLVWLVFRRIRLLPLLALSLTLVFGLTLSTCGLWMGTLTALTIGFGAILIGLSADYGILVFQALRRQPTSPATALQQVRPSVLWAMSTTAAVFLALIPLGFPGLADLGRLVAVGVLIGAAVMLLLFPRLLLRWGGLQQETAPTQPTHSAASAEHLSRRAAPIVLLLLLGLSAGLLVRGMPHADARSGSLRPEHSEAYAGMDHLEKRLGGSDGGLSLILTADSIDAMDQRLQQTHNWLQKHQSDIITSGLPMEMWPRPQAQQLALKNTAASWVAQADRLHQALDTAGFTEEAWQLSQRMIAHWADWLQHGVPILPRSTTAHWLAERLVSLPQPQDASPEAATLGRLNLRTSADPAQLQADAPEGVYLVGGGLMERTLDRYLQRGFAGVSLLFSLITLAILALALRAWRPLLLVSICIILSFSALLGLMSWLDLDWNAFTLPALLLSLGTGSDYFIHLILRIRREKSPGAAGRALAELAPALTVCGGSTILGFGSLLTAAIPGLSSMGLVCAAALALNLLTALTLLPWMAGNGSEKRAS